MEADEAPLLPDLKRLHQIGHNSITAWQTRRDKGRHSNEASKAAPIPTRVTGLSQAQACEGPWVKADDSPAASVAPPKNKGRNATRRHQTRMSPKAIIRGANKLSAMQKACVSRLRGRACSERAGSQTTKGVSHNQSANAAIRRSATCPSPNGTEAGYSKANGHKASNTSPPCAPGANHSSRKRLHRASPPQRSSTTIMPAPTKPPNELRPKSTLEGTRPGRNVCKLSTVTDKVIAPAAPHQKAPRRHPNRSAATANRAPSGM
jgi:hypothetical protein